MWMAITVFVLSVTTSVLVGMFGTTIYQYQRPGSAGFNAQGDQIVFLLQAGLGTLAGVTAIVLGIVAVVQKRGRAFGVVAIVVAAAAPFVSLVVWALLGLQFGHHVSV